MKPVEGTFYRLKETARAGEIFAPAYSPELTRLTLFRWNTFGAPTLGLENMGNSQEQQ